MAAMEALEEQVAALIKRLSKKTQTGKRDAMRVVEIAQQLLIYRRRVRTAEAMMEELQRQHRDKTELAERVQATLELAHADPAAELPALAVALNARMRLQSSAGERWVSASEFFLGLFTTALDLDELLVEVAIPPLPTRSGSAFAEVARRHGDYALAGAAAVVTLSDAGTIADSRLVFCRRSYRCRA